MKEHKSTEVSKCCGEKRFEFPVVGINRGEDTPFYDGCGKCRKVFVLAPEKEEVEVYCPKCGSCGEEGCCSKTCPFCQQTPCVKEYKGCYENVPAPQKQGEEDKLIEQCIGIMGNKAYQGSYAGPREAFRKVLTLAYDRGVGEIKKKVEKMKKDTAPYGFDFSNCAPERVGYNQAITDVLTLLEGKGK